jgi:hypothetical protein
MKRSLIVFSTVAVLCYSAALSGQGRDPIAGAWEQISAKNLTTGAALQQPNPPLHLIYSNGQYVQFAAMAGRPKIQKPSEQMTKDELLARTTGTQGQYGTYRVEGNKITRKIISAADPNNEGREIAAEFRIEGDSLIVTNKNLQGETVETRYRRLGQRS